MISYSVYKIVHYAGLFVALAAVVAFLARVPLMDRGERRTDPWQRRLIALHGTGLFLVLLGGFGMLARLGITEGLGLPGWIWAKLVLWVGLGALVSIGKRKRDAAPWLLLAAPLLAILAGAVAHLKPF